jgi:hypothetical protein
MSDTEVKKGNGGKIGAALGAAAGALGTVMANPLGRWAMFTAQTDTALNVHNLVEDIFHSRAAGDMAYTVFCRITDVILAYPAILPIAGGVIAAGVGALIGKKISKSKLKRQNMKPVNSMKLT